MKNGVAEYCADNGIRLIAHRPLGGERVKTLRKDAVLSEIASKHTATNAEVALAWLMGLGGGIVPIPGATRVETATSLARVLAIVLDDDDRAALDARFSGRLLRVPRAQRRPKDDADGEVVIVMGSPGAGKSTLAHTLVADGYHRLNRDIVGGSLAKLALQLDELLTAGHRRIVLDNTYPTRKSRNEVIETAWRRGVPVRCVWLTTDVANAQVNSIHRMLELHGGLPTPEEIRQLGKKDTRYLLPDALFRYERSLEPPSLEEGFTAVDARAFVREPEHGGARALVLDLDDVCEAAAPVLQPGDVAISPSRRDIVARYGADGWILFVHAWRPQLERGTTTVQDVMACFTRLRELLGADVDVAHCPHDAGPPVCWCRKPIPGSVLAVAKRRGVSLSESVVVGASAADRTMAERIGARFEPSASFFA
jgi:histidinol phosphatase-like enzyme